MASNPERAPKVTPDEGPFAPWLRCVGARNGILAAGYEEVRGAGRACEPEEESQGYDGRGEAKKKIKEKRQAFGLIFLDIVGHEVCAYPHNYRKCCNRRYSSLSTYSTRLISVFAQSLNTFIAGCPPLPFAYARKLKINVANVAKRENYTLADTAEASRIARELVKLHRDGAIKTAGDASFYANLVRDFSATYAKNDRNHPDHPPMDRVPQPPRGISPQERIKFYQADLADAFGEEFIDRDYQPPSPARRLKPKEKARGKG